MGAERTENLSRRRGLGGLIRNLKQYEPVQSRKGFMGAERTENLSRRRGLGGLIRNLK